MFKTYTIDNDLNMDFDRFWGIVNNKDINNSINLPDTDSNEVRNEVDRLVEKYFTYEKTYPANKLAYLSQNFTVKDGVITLSLIHISEPTRPY